eukprot:6480441-Amphidinium_carterae.1
MLGTLLPGDESLALQKLYSTATTNFHIGEITSSQVRVRRGVLQGCPGSPLLFVTALSLALAECERKKWQVSPHAGWHFPDPAAPQDCRALYGQLRADSRLPPLHAQRPQFSPDAT